MRALATRQLPRELSDDRAFAVRVKRLGAVSLVALGAIWWLAVATTQASPLVGAMLAAGWALMPAMLFASLRLPALRWALVVPASLVGGGLLAVVATIPPAWPAALGWQLITAGVVLGGLLGLWFWFRLLPVPAALDDPFSRGRWTLIVLHVALIVAGLALVAATAL